VHIAGPRSLVDRSQEWVSLKEGIAMKSMLASMAVQEAHKAMGM
jgi:hypothetical protein